MYNECTILYLMYIHDGYRANTECSLYMSLVNSTLTINAEYFITQWQGLSIVSKMMIFSWSALQLIGSFKKKKSVTVITCMCVLWLSQHVTLTLLHVSLAVVCVCVCNRCMFAQSTSPLLVGTETSILTMPIQFQHQLPTWNWHYGSRFT